MNFNKEERFAPLNGPGVFGVSTAFYDPGPGTYNLRGVNSSPKLTMTAKVPILIAEKCAPSIPTTKPGYIEDPGDPNINFIKKSERVVDFTKSKFKRNPFEAENKLDLNYSGPLRDISSLGCVPILSKQPLPGPGHYQVQEGFTKGITSSLVSKIPNCSNLISDNKIPGPGTYIKDLTFESKNHRQMSFNTNTKRDNDWWENNLDAPFTKPTNKFNPGP
jgi:hypothetical protein